MEDIAEVQTCHFPTELRLDMDKLPTLLGWKIAVNVKLLPAAIVAGRDGTVPSSKLVLEETAAPVTWRAILALQEMVLGALLVPIS